MTKIEVVVFATLRRYVPDLLLGETKKLDVAAGTKVIDLAHQLGIPVEEVHIVMRNNLQSSLDAEVAEGDRVALIPAVGGG